MELADLFLFMLENSKIVPSIGKLGLILDNLSFEVVNHPSAHGQMRGSDDIAQKIAAGMN